MEAALAHTACDWVLILPVDMPFLPTALLEMWMRGVVARPTARVALFTVEGVGLLSRKIWAEWLTIVITCSFIPLEIYEVVEKGSVMKAVVLVANILIAIYLIARRLHAHHKHGLVGWLKERFGSCTMEPARDWADEKLEEFLVMKAGD